MNFVTINKRTIQFKSKVTNYKYEKNITSKAEDTIIVDSRSENVHPSIWKIEWFEDEIEAKKYLSKYQSKAA